MSVLYGTKERFAIEWELNADYGGDWLFGKFCFWIGGTMVGDYDVGESFSVVIGQLTYPVGDCGKRQSERFCGMSGAEAFSLIYRSFYDDDFPTPPELELESWARFDVTIDMDVFDGWKLYLFDCPTLSRLLVGRRQNEGGYKLAFEQQLEVGEFDGVICRFRDELNAIWEHEHVEHL